MNRHQSACRWSLLLSIVALCGTAAAADVENEMPPAEAGSPEALPDEAQKLVASFDHDAADIRRQAQKEIADRQQKLIDQLAKLQDEYSKPGTLDQAVAIRERIRQLKSDLKAATVNAKPDPGNLAEFRPLIGQVFHFRVVGSTNGFVFGSGTYSDDSTLATAAVHAGILRNGQQGIVKVTILPGQGQYIGSLRNGVMSHPWTDWMGSYRVEVP